MKGKSNNNDKGHRAPRSEKAFFARQEKQVATTRRRCTLVNVVTGVTGNSLAYAVGSNNATSSFEFSNYAALYQEYRVRAIRTRVVPRVRDNIQTAVGVIMPGTIVSGKYATGAAAGTYAAVFAEDGSRVHPEWTVAENMVTWESNPTAKLWTSTTTTVPTANQIGLQFLSTAVCPAVFNTVILYDTFTEYDIEFRGLL